MAAPDPWGVAATSPFTPAAQDADPWGVASSAPMGAAAAAVTPAVDTSFTRYGIEAGKGFVEGAKNVPASALQGAGTVMATAGPIAVRKQLEVMDRIDRGEQVADADDPLGYQYANPEQRVQLRADYENYQPTPIAEHPVYRAGTALQDLGKETFAAAPGWEDSWTRDIAGGFGSVGAGIALSLVSPAAGGLMFVSSGQGEAAQRALQAGATPEQVRRAALSGTVAGATDVVDAMLPMLGSYGKAASLIQRIGPAVIKGAFAEGGQEGVQALIQNSIAKGIYKPDQEYFEDVPRNVAIGMIVGGATSGPGAIRKGEQGSPAAAQVDATAPATDGAEAAAPRPEAQPVPEAPAQTGYDAAAEVLGASPVPPQASPVTAPPAAAPAQPAINPELAALLHGYGYTPEQIAMMAPEMLAAEAEAARSQGAEPRTIPEADATLLEQQRQLIEGQRAAQMFPQGTGELPLPENAARVVTPSGDVFHFDPEKVELPQILEASANGRENDVLGLGPFSKEDLAPRVAAGEQPVAVVERSPEGTEVRAAAGTEGTAPWQVAAMEPEASPGNTVAVEQPEQVLADRAAPSGDIAYLSPKQIQVDAKRFQYKGNSDQRGVTGALSGVRKWDDRLANPILAWQARDGTVYVANGHQRTDLARRAEEAGQENIRIPARILREEDGYTPQDMKTLGAFQNIAEGSGTAVDAARILRDPAVAEMGMPPLPPKSQLVQQAQSLAQLSDEAFGMVVNGVVPEAYAAQVGRILKDPAEQLAAMDMLAKAQPETIEQARIMTEDILDSGFLNGAQSTMFGEEEFAKSLVPERAKILDNALRTLRRTRTVFKTAVEQEGTLAGAGNVLARDTNIKAKTDHERLAEILRANGTRTGPISSALTEAARELAGGKKLPAVTSQFLGRVRQLAPGADQATAEQGAAADRDGHPGEESRALFQRPRRTEGQPDLLTDRGADNKPQTVLPGTERISDRELAQRKADAPLKPKKEQKPLESGLFGDSAAQGEMKFQRAPTFYSAVVRAVEKAKIQKGQPEQWMATIRNTPGVKAEELEWLGLDDWLKEQKGPVTREALLDYVRANQIEVKEVEKGPRPDTTIEARARELAETENGPGSWDRIGGGGQEHYWRDARREAGTKYSSYTLPGGENYRELLLTLPRRGEKLTAQEVAERYGRTWSDVAPYERQQFAEAAEREAGKDDYRSSHWDEPNILAHVRFNDRTVDGKKTLFIEEVQSDWHQAGKRKGYQGKHKATIEHRPEQDAKFPWAVVMQGEVVQRAANESLARAEAADLERRWKSGVPDAPFKTTWPELAFKRMIRYAAEHGYDQIAWTPGDVQADRYDLSKQIDTIKFTRANKDAQGGKLLAIDKNNVPVISDSVSIDRLPEIVGKEAADKLLKQDFTQTHASGTGYQTLENADLKVGGEGMRGFYDKILPATVNKLVKKFGAKVSGSTIENGTPAAYTVVHNGHQRGHFATRQEAIAWAQDEGIYNSARIREIPGESAPSTAVHTLPITSSMREAALGEGFPMFRHDREAGESGLPDDAVKLWQRSNGAALYGIPAKPYLDNEARILRDVYRVIKKIAPTADVRSFQKLLARGMGRDQLRAANGVYWKQVGADPRHVIAWSLESPDAIGTVRHEAIHFLRHTGAISEPEWQALSDAAVKNGWIRKHEIDTRYPDLPRESQIEEAIAEEFADWQRGSKEPSLVRAAFEKLQRLLRQIAAASRSVFGKNATADDIFTLIEAGKVGARNKGAEQGEAKLQTPRLAQQNLPLHPGVSVPNEIIADRLEARNLPKLARIAKALKLGSANPTEFRTRLQDKFIRWKAIQDAVEKATGRKLPEWMNTYQAESLYYGRTGQRLEKLDADHIDPLINEIQSRGLSLEQVDEYLMARHAPERNRELRKINKDIADPSGMSDAKAAEIIDRIDRSGKRADYVAVEDRVRALIDETQQTLLKGGLISQEQLQAWRKYKNYVPLRGFAEGEESTDPGGYGTGRGFDIRKGPEDKRALGRSSVADSPLGHVMMAAQQAVVRAEKNKVGLTALRFVQNNPDPELWTVDKGDPKRVIDPKTGLVTIVGDPTYINDPNVFAVKIDGKPHYINFKGEYGESLARALKNLGTANMGSVMQFISAITRFQARLVTSWNPDFMIPNFLRDAGEAFINLQEQDQKKFVKQFAKHLIPAMGGSFNALRGADGGKYAKAFREFDEAGGRIRFFGLENVEDIKKNTAAKMRRLEGGIINDFRDAGKKALDAIEIANGSIENATRLAAFMAAIDVGLPPAKAASIARELTVNFNRKGEYGSIISGLYMFANAAMQGQVRMVRAMQNKNVRRYAYALGAAGAALAMYNIGAGGDDDDGVPYYLKITPWVRDSNLILMWPKGMGHDGKYVTIPLPYGYAFFNVMGSRMASMIYGKEKPKKALDAIVKSTLDTFDPLGRDENLIAQFTPSLGKPFVHIYTNQNWTGKKISPEPMPWNKNQPDAYRHFRSASPFAVGAADKLNQWTGGSKRESGLIDVTPGTVDYMLGFAGGGLGRFFNNAHTVAWGAYQGTEWQPSKTPIVRRFYGEKDRRSDQQLYYEARDEVQKAKEILDGYRKDGDAANARRIAREYAPELATHSAIFDRTSGSDARLRVIHKKMDAIKADTKLSEKEREKQLKVEEAREDQIIAATRKLLAKNRQSRQPAGASQ